MNTQQILYVEDEETDVILMQYAWRKAGVPNPLHCLEDGDKAMRYLGGEGDFADRTRYPMPGLVLLDLKLPKVSGFEVLKWIREQPAFHTLLVVVFSSSNQPADIHKAHALRANAFVTKPSGSGNLEETVKSVRDFWLKQAHLPPECSQFKD